MKSYKCITINKKQVRLHRYIMECHLGRSLKSNELVHHVNGDKHDNRVANLKIMSRSDHMKEHQDTRPIGNRFIKIFYINPEEVLELFKKTGMAEIAQIYGCSQGTIHRVIKKNNLRSRIICTVCGKPATYRKKQLCNKHYLKKYNEGRNGRNRENL